MVEATGVRDIPSGPLLRIGHDRFIPGLRKLVETVRRRSGGHTRFFIQIIDFLAVKRRPEKAKYFESYFAPSDRHRRALAEAMNEQSWLAATDQQVRALLKAAPDDLIEVALDESEIESCVTLSRARTDTHLAHIKELPLCCRRFLQPQPARARSGI